MNDVERVLIWTGIGLLIVAGYGLACWWRPYADCWCCKGVGKHYREKDGKRMKTFRKCRWCRGTSARLRIGRRVYNYYAKDAKDV
jgi:hypothetical protein